MSIRQIALLAVTLPWALAGASEKGEDHDLLGNMGTLQYLSHKLDLSIRHQNRELVDRTFSTFHASGEVSDRRTRLRSVSSGLVRI